MEVPPARIGFFSSHSSFFRFMTLLRYSLRLLPKVKRFVEKEDELDVESVIAFVRAPFQRWTGTTVVINISRKRDMVSLSQRRKY